MEVDSNQIFDGVTLALHRAYPDSNIHGTEVEQGLYDGDYIVLPITTTNSAQMGSRSKQKVLFDVIYYPSAQGGRAECLRIADSLPRVLGTIVTPNGDCVQCSTFECNIETDALHCVVGYAYFAYSPREDDPMETHNMKQEV